ncbi:MAG: YggS family pyridoxal phosphate-dependent enzyme [Clostridiales bacterium]|nr:YggS family pyridoxal phosphate-dependent enzyme [Clostridiales bacterium]
MSVAENLAEIRSRIDELARSAGRNPEEVKLIAVSKTKPVSLIKEAVAAGALDLGENKPQEIVSKYPEFEGDSVRWHMIGHLQKNKVRHIIDKAELIHSVDSLALAEEINKRAEAIGKIQKILIQVNVTGEDSKSGVSPGDAAELCREISKLNNVRIMGLMTISVSGYTYEENKSVFDSLAVLAARIDDMKIDNVSMKELSMGMTHDFDAAIAAGATMVRVGTAIFGARDYGAKNNAN